MGAGIAKLLEHSEPIRLTVHKRHKVLSKNNGKTGAVICVNQYISFVETPLKFLQLKGISMGMRQQRDAQCTVNKLPRT